MKIVVFSEMPNDFSISSNKTSVWRIYKYLLAMHMVYLKNQNHVAEKDVYIAFESAGIQSANQLATGPH